MAYPEYIDYKFALARGEKATLTNLHAYCDTMSETANGFILQPYNLYAMTTPAVNTAAAQVMRIVSTDANDVSSGSGVQQATIHGVGPDGANVSVNMTMTGQTPNQTTQLFVAVNRVTCVTCGSGGVNAGDIYVVGAADSTNAGVPKGTSTCYAIMAAGNGVNTDGRYLVPSSYTAYITNVIWGENHSTHKTTLRAWSKVAGESKKQLLAKSTGQRAMQFETPIKLAENTYFWIDGTADTSATTADIIVQMALFTGD